MITNNTRAEKSQNHRTLVIFKQNDDHFLCRRINYVHGLLVYTCKSYSPLARLI